MMDDFPGKEIIFDGKKICLKKIFLDEPTADEVIIKSEWSQVSIGTEIATILKAKESSTETQLGYSLVGVVIKKGREASVEVGKRILTLCPHASFVKLRAIPETMVEVPPEVPSDIACCGILGSVAFHIVQRGGIRLGESVAVFGQGIIGSFCMQIVKMCGGRPVIAVDVNEERLKIAEEYGADYGVNPEKEDLESAIDKITRGKRLNVAIEATGKAPPIEKAVKCLGIGGRLILSSYTFERISLSVHEDIVEKELTIIGAHQPKCPVKSIFYYPFSQVKNRILAMELLNEGKLKVTKLISHRITPEEAPNIYAQMLKGNQKISGILINWENR